MADATGTPTTNYSFKTIDGEDTAGYTSINSVITSIDTQLQDKAFKTNMVILYSSATSPTVSGWTLAPASVSPPGTAGRGGGDTGLPTVSGNYWWLKKS